LWAVAELEEIRFTSVAAVAVVPVQWLCIPHSA
jgi:hypothetical protein